MGDADKAVKKTEKKAKKVAKDITEDENKQHKLLLGLGSVMTAVGIALTGWSGRQVDKYRKQNN
jgi:hypothetical protein